MFTHYESNEAVNYPSVIHLYFTVYILYFTVYILYCIVYIMYFTVCILYFTVDITHRKNVTRPFEDATSIVSASNLTYTGSVV